MIDATTTVRFESRTGIVVKLCDQSVDFKVGPIVEQLALGQLWEGGPHCGSLFDGPLLDTQALILREAGQSLLDGLDVEESNGKWTDATIGAAESAGHFTEQGGSGPVEPMGRVLVQRSRVGRSWTCHGGLFHFNGEIEDQVAFGGVKALVIDLDDAVTLLLVEL